VALGIDGVVFSHLHLLGQVGHEAFFLEVLDLFGGHRHVVQEVLAVDAALKLVIYVFLVIFYYFFVVDQFGREVD